MKSSILNWKQVAQIIGLILLITCCSDLLSYFRYYDSFSNPMVPEEVRVRVTRPYMIGFVALSISSIVAGAALYFGRHKVSAIISIIALVSNFIFYKIIWWT